MPDPSAGEVGGIFAGLVALLATIGAGLRWLLGWDERRKQTRYEKLEAWQRELEAREESIDTKQAEYQERIERQLDAVQLQNAALIGAYHLIVGALRRQDPRNPALGEADDILAKAFPVDFVIPPQMAGLLASIRREAIPSSGEPQ